MRTCKASKAVVCAVAMILLLQPTARPLAPPSDNELLRKLARIASLYETIEAVMTAPTHVELRALAERLQLPRTFPGPHFDVLFDLETKIMYFYYAIEDIPEIYEITNDLSVSQSSSRLTEGDSPIWIESIKGMQVRLYRRTDRIVRRVEARRDRHMLMSSAQGKLLERKTFQVAVTLEGDATREAIKDRLAAISEDFFRSVGIYVSGALMSRVRPVLTRSMQERVQHALHFVLHHALDNAVDAVAMAYDDLSEDRRVVSVEIRVYEKELELEVSDRGIGLSLDGQTLYGTALQKMFLTQGLVKEDANLPHQGGERQGLRSMVSWTENSGGLLKAEATAGGGTTVTIALPLVDIPGEKIALEGSMLNQIRDAYALWRERHPEAEEDEAALALWEAMVNGGLDPALHYTDLYLDYFVLPYPRKTRSGVLAAIVGLRAGKYRDSREAAAAQRIPVSEIQRAFQPVDLGDFHHRSANRDEQLQALLKSVEVVTREDKRKALTRILKPIVARDVSTLDDLLEAALSAKGLARYNLVRTLAEVFSNPGEYDKKRVLDQGLADRLMNLHESLAQERRLDIVTDELEIRGQDTWKKERNDNKDLKETDLRLLLRESQRDLLRVLNDVFSKDRNLRLQSEHLRWLFCTMELMSGPLRGMDLSEALSDAIERRLSDKADFILDQAQYQGIMNAAYKVSVAQREEEEGIHRYGETIHSWRIRTLGIAAANNPDHLQSLMKGVKYGANHTKKATYSHALGIALAWNPLLKDRMETALKEDVGLSRIEFRPGGAAPNTVGDFAEGLLSHISALTLKEPPRRIPVIAPPGIPRNLPPVLGVAEDLFGATFLRAQGRTLLYRKPDGAIIGMKVLREGEDPALLVYESEWFSYLNRNNTELGLRGKYPRPYLLGGVSAARVTLNSSASSMLTAQRDKDGKPFVLDRKEGMYAVMAYEVDDEDYFTYLNDAALDEEVFRKASLINLHDLFALARYGILQTELADMFHNPDSAHRAGLIRFLPMSDIINPERPPVGVGRLHAWPKAIAYLNERVSGLADFSGLRMFRDLLHFKDPAAAHFASLKKHHPDYPVEAIVMANTLSEYVLTWALSVGKYYRDKGTLDWDRPQALAKLLQEGLETSYRAFTGYAQGELSTPGRAVHWERLAMQMGLVLWKAKGGKAEVYASFLEGKNIPAEVYGLDPSKILYAKNVDMPDWISNEERRGVYADGQNPDIGFPYSAFWIQELVKAWYLYSALMVSEVRADRPSAMEVDFYRNTMIESLRSTEVAL